MSSVRTRIEAAFARAAVLIYRHPLRTLLIIGVALAALVAQLPRMTFDTSTESFFRKSDPALIAYNRFRAQFGRDEFIVAAWKS